MKNIAITFGLISGALIIIYTFGLLMYIGDPIEMSSKDLEIAGVLGYLRYLILILTVFFAMRAHKQQLQPPFTYGKLVKTGLAVSAVVALLVGLMEFTYIAMNPDFVDAYMNNYLKGMQEAGASAAEIAEQKEMMMNFEFMRSPLLTGLFYFFETALIGTVVSLILAIFMRTKTPKLTTA